MRHQLCLIADPDLATAVLVDEEIGLAGLAAVLRVDQVGTAGKGDAIAVVRRRRPIEAVDLLQEGAALAQVRQGAIQRREALQTGGQAVGRTALGAARARLQRFVRSGGLLRTCA